MIMFFVSSEALPFFLLLIDLSKASALAKMAFMSRSKVCDAHVVSCGEPVHDMLAVFFRKKSERI